MSALVREPHQLTGTALERQAMKRRNPFYSLE
jgi:hypothetical protein